MMTTLWEKMHALAGRIAFEFIRCQQAVRRIAGLSPLKSGDWTHLPARLPTRADADYAGRVEVYNRNNGDVFLTSSDCLEPHWSEYYWRTPGGRKATRQARREQTAQAMSA